MTRRAWLLASLSALAACASLPSRRLREDVGLELLEPIFDVRWDPTGVTIQVRATGCTAKSDFVFYLSRDGARTLAFARRRVDDCKAPPATVPLSWTYAELGVAQGRRPRVVNPRQAGSRPFSASRVFSSPAWNISRTMSQPPTNSPLT